MVKVICDKCGIETEGDAYYEGRNCLFCTSDFSWRSKFDLEDFKYHLCENCTELFQEWLKIKTAK